MAIRLSIVRNTKKRKEAARMAEIKNCPFCGEKVELMNLFTPIRMFYCTNYRECGAVVSFDNHLCNREAGDRHKIKCWNRRADNG